MSAGLLDPERQALLIRLRQVRDDSAHLVMHLDVKSAHNCILRLHDIALYIGMWPGHLARFTKMTGKTRVIMTDAQVQKLKEFFVKWDHRQLHKMYVPGEDAWRLVEPGEALAKNATAPREAPRPRPDIRMVIDRETLGLKIL